MTARHSLAGTIATALLAVLLPLVMQPAQAATIVWGSPQNITGSADVDTTGTLFTSANFGGASVSNVTVNGVQFNAFPIINTGTSQTVGTITLSGTSNSPTFPNLQGSGTTLGGPASYNGLLSQTAFMSGSASQPTLEVSISGLTIGAAYLIQYWVNDGRTSPTNFSNRTTIIDGKTLDVNVTNTSGGFGQFIIGTFTADASTQSFNAVAGSPGNRVDANAMQVRVVAVPEPSTICLAAVGLVSAEVVRRSRRRKARAC